MYKTTDPHPQRGHELWARVGDWLSDDYNFKRGLTFGLILAVALVAFEIFNFSTTEFALRDLLGEARFVGVQWATILSVAFCGIDFAGLARLFTPERDRPQPLEVWYLVGAWFLGATMNAMMTWWAVSLTLLNHTIGNEVLTRDELLTYVPILVATLVWLTRILIIGTFSVAGERLFAHARAAVREVRLAQARTGVARPTVGPQAAEARQATREPTPSARAKAAKHQPGTPGQRATFIGTEPDDKPEPHYEDFDADDRAGGSIRPVPRPTSRARFEQGGKLNGSHKPAHRR